MASALLLVALAGCGSDDRSTPRPVPATSAPLVTKAADPVGPPPEIPWWSDGKLHLPDGVIRTPMRQIVARGGTTIVGNATPHGSHWMILRGDALADLLSTRSVGVRPVLSANGRFAAWTTSFVTHRYNEFDADVAFTVTAYDVSDGSVTGTTVFDSRTACCSGDGGIMVAGVDDDGAVLIARYADRAWVWHAGREPVEITDHVSPGHMSGNDQWPGGISWTTTGDSGDPAVFARVSATGSVSRVGRVPQTQGGLWSPNGTAYAYAPARAKVQLRPVVWHDGQRQVLHAPRGSWPLAWESDRRVLLVDGDLDVSIDLLRCWVGDGRCERAGRPLRHAQVSDTFVF